MPLTNEELETKIEELNNTLKEVSILLENHKHLGQQTYNIKSIIRLASHIDAKKYKVAGTDGKNATATVRNATDDGSCTIIFTNGIVTGGTCFP